MMEIENRVGKTERPESGGIVWRVITYRRERTRVPVQIAVETAEAASVANTGSSLQVAVSKARRSVALPAPFLS
jgi:acyl-CoA thioesterase FadM